MLEQFSSVMEQVVDWYAYRAGWQDELRHLIELIEENAKKEMAMQMVAFPFMVIVVF